MASDFHLTAVWGQDQQCKQDKLQDTVNDVGLQIQHLQLDEEEVLRDQSDIQNDLHTSKDSEWDRSWDDNDSLVDTQSDLLRRS